MTRFLTIFSNLDNVHLIKDVGLIPYLVGNLPGYDSQLVGMRHEEDYPNLHSEAKGLKVKFLEYRHKVSGIQPELIFYILENARKIDILHLFHYTPQSFLYALVYKLRNPNGFVYLKLDHDTISLQEHGVLYHINNPIKRVFFKILERLIYNFIGLYSIESTKGLQLIKRFYPYNRKIVYSPNGLFTQNYIDENKLYAATDKSESLITVQRVGTYQKNTEMLLNAYANCSTNQWPLTIVGPIDKSYEDFQKSWSKKHPELQSRVTYTGSISEHKKVRELLRKSKIFCITSRWEGMPFSILEAVLCGCYIVSTDFASIHDVITKDMGTIVKSEDTQEFANALTKLMASGVPPIDIVKNQEYIKGRFDWNAIVTDILKEIETRRR